MNNEGWKDGKIRWVQRRIFRLDRHYQKARWISVMNGAMDVDASPLAPMTAEDDHDIDHMKPSWDQEVLSLLLCRI